jgi:hypothetical protein
MQPKQGTGMHVRVQTGIGHRGMPMPRRLQFGRHFIDIVGTIDQWHGADHRYVKIRGGDGSLYILRYDILRDDWELTMFESLRAQAFQTLRHGRELRRP